VNRRERFQSELGELYSEVDLRRLLDAMGSKIKRDLPCEEASIFLYHPGREELTFETATGRRSGALKRIVLRRGEGIAGWIADHHEPVIANDCARDPRFSSFTDRLVQFSTRSIAGTPVGTPDNLLGVLEAINKIGGEFTADDLDFLHFISTFVQIPLQNALLFRKITQESREKAHLIDLGKRISSAVDLDEVFSALRTIVADIARAEEINIYVASTRRLHRLIQGGQEESSPREVSRSVRLERAALFPFLARGRNLGFLELKLAQKLPDEGYALLRGLASFAAIALDKFELAQEMVATARVRRELQIAAGIQRSFLPSGPILFPGLEIAYSVLPSSEVGGDYVEFVPRGEELIVTVADVAGHGVPASLLMAIFRTDFLFAMRQGRPLTEALDHLGDLIAETTDISMYVTTLACALRPGAGTLDFINAGHPGPVIVRRGDTLEPSEGELPLGLFAGTHYRETRVALVPGDLVALFTDGVIEAENEARQAFGRERLRRFLRERAALPVAVVRDQLIQELTAFSGSPPFADDVTLVLLKVKG